MIADALIVSSPALNPQFLSIGQQALGRSLSAAADACPRKMTDAERFLMALAELTGWDIEDLLAHVSFSVLVVYERRAAPSLASVLGCPFVEANTVRSEAAIAVLTQSVEGWQHAIRRGLSADQPAEVRAVVAKILSAFESQGFRLWSDCVRKIAGSVLYLEDKR